MSGGTGESLTDEALVARIRASPRDDVQHFDTLLRRHWARIVANCRYLTGQPDQAEDLAQEVFVKAYFALDGFRGGSSFRTWLQRIKVNHCLDHVKARRSRPAFVDAAAEDLAAAPAMMVEADAERDLLDREQRQRMAAAIDALPDSLRIPLTLRDLDGFTYDEIAGKLGLGLSAVKMRILRARRTVRERIGGVAAPRPSTGGEQ
ncbi:MAG: sigma-70 family RNA polymerase sigma factor [Acidobacteria bacterium]|nr:sigma-70 family RNA polymerase sigma factor [Acidobacteriota bacterium]